MGKEVVSIMPEPTTEKPKGVLTRLFQKKKIEERAEKVDKPGTIISRALGKLFNRTEKTEVQEEVRKAIVEVKKEVLPKKPYDLAAAMEHFESLKWTEKDFLVNHFNTYYPGDSRDPYGLFEAIYRFQDKNGLKKNGIGDKIVRQKMASESQIKLEE